VSEQGPDEGRLLDQLFAQSNYQIYSRPVSLDSTSVLVQVGLSLTHIFDVVSCFQVFFCFMNLIAKTRPTKESNIFYCNSKSVYTKTVNCMFRICACVYC
jgi:hypothetical protein